MTSAVTAAGFLIEELVEPQPSQELALIDATAYQKLTTAPRFLFFRLRPAPAD